MYENLEYDPTIPGLLTDKYEDLSKYEEFTEAGDIGRNTLDKVIRFVILYNDEDSPFFKEKDLDERHRKCIVAAKADLNAENCIVSGHPIYRRVLLRWFKLKSSYLFEDWISRKIAWHEESSYLSASLATAPDPEKMIQRKNDIRRNREEDRRVLMDLEQQLFSDRKIQKLVNKAANESGLTGWAEKMAEDYTPPD